ncbi:MAG: single-stranded DNA-binding protein [Propionibacteriales bacterium]|nr:single-stranded DNA-binding protein [Propionibacteriales bacterium]
MNETTITVMGHVATDPTLRTTSGGARVGSFRLAATERRFDKGLNAWRDWHTTFFTVTSWRTLAENVCESVQKGQPVVVHGRLRDSSYDNREGQRRTVLEIEAFAVGHDLSRGVARFAKAEAAANVNVVREIEEVGEHEVVDPVTGEITPRAGRDGASSDVVAPPETAATSAA